MNDATVDVAMCAWGAIATEQNMDHAPYKTLNVSVLETTETDKICPAVPIPALDRQDKRKDHRWQTTR